LRQSQNLQASPDQAQLAEYYLPSHLWKKKIKEMRICPSFNSESFFIYIDKRVKNLDDTSKEQPNKHLKVSRCKNKNIN